MYTEGSWRLSVAGSADLCFSIMTHAAAPRPFAVSPRPDAKLWRKSLLWITRPAVERALRFPALNAIYAEIKAQGLEDHHFADQALHALRVTWEVADDQIERIPRTGPAVLVANHPFGGIEGLILCSLLRRVRPDFKILANYLLSLIPELRECFFFVDPFEGKAAAKRNMKTMREALRWVEGGRLLGVFPAGEVSHLRLRNRAIVDPEWNTTVGRIVQRTGAPVAPLFFDGRNSNLFQLMGLIHPRLRTVMLPREMLKKRGGRVSMRIGGTIPAQRLQRFDTPRELTDYLRVRTYIIRRDPRETEYDASEIEAGYEPVAPAVAPALLEQEVAQLHEAGQLLHQQDELAVYFGRGDRIPNVLTELGRLRELAFRAVKEGSGKPLDLESFDHYYDHLFIWDREKLRIVGAYRLGGTDRILPEHGRSGLYTSSLFRIKRGLLDQISPAIELGRSFVRLEEQKSFAPLMLLWKGISLYVCRYPRYRYLFGPVSISAAYSSMSKRLLMRFLEINSSLPQLGKLIKPRNPPRMRGHRSVDPAQFSMVVRDLKEVNELISELEADGKSMPVLVRQYLKLGGQLLGFNIDPEFGDVLDGLMLFDVPAMDRAILNRYMGREKCAEYLARYGVE